MYRGMSLQRILDNRMLALQRQGRIGFYGPSLGQEAAIVGAAMAMGPEDWIVPQYREPGAALVRGMPLKELLCQLMGNAEDPVKGHQMPCHYVYRKGNYLSISSPVGTQLPHAVGIGWAMTLRGEKKAVLVFFGDGATSTGDFHAAMNFAGVFKTPTVFLCNNNQWAISVPVSKQTASRTRAGGTRGARPGSNKRSGTRSPVRFRRPNGSLRPRSRRSSPTCTPRCRPTSVKRWTPSWGSLGGSRMAKKGSAAPAPAPSSSSGVQRAHELFKQGRAKEALALLRPRLQRKGDVDANVCALAAACLGAEGDYMEAARIDRLLCNAQPNNPQAWHSLGYDLFHAGDLEGAAEAFSRALKLEPTRASAHFNLARIAARLGDKSKVIEHFARAVELQPDYQERLDEDPDLLPFKDDPAMLERLPGGKVGEDPYQEYYATRS